MRVYVAASWRTPSQPAVVRVLSNAGHLVYDFRHDGFSWKEVDPQWQFKRSVGDYLKAVQHPAAQRGFERDRYALDWCEVCVLLQPSGRSAHLELGYAIGKGKLGVVLLSPGEEWDLMYKLAHLRAATLDEVVSFLGG